MLWRRTATGCLALTVVVAYGRMFWLMPHGLEFLGTAACSKVATLELREGSTKPGKNDTVELDKFNRLCRHIQPGPSHQQQQPSSLIVYGMIMPSTVPEERRRLRAVLNTWGKPLLADRRLLVAGDVWPDNGPDTYPAPPGFIATNCSASWQGVGCRSAELFIEAARRDADWLVLVHPDYYVITARLDLELRAAGGSGQPGPRGEVLAGNFGCVVPSVCDLATQRHGICGSKPFAVNRGALNAFVADDPDDLRALARNLSHTYSIGAEDVMDTCIARSREVPIRHFEPLSRVYMVGIDADRNSATLGPVTKACDPDEVITNGNKRRSPTADYFEQEVTIASCYGYNGLHEGLTAEVVAVHLFEGVQNRSAGLYAVHRGVTQRCIEPTPQGSCTSTLPRYVHPRDGVPGAYLAFPPPSDESLHRLVMWPASTRPKLESIRRHLERGDRPVTVVVFGGSMTGGANCDEPGYGKMKQCAWPSRVERYLQAAYPAATIEVHNLSRGGTQSEAAVASLPMQIRALKRVPDMIMLDHGVNDVYEFGGPDGKFESRAGRTVSNKEKAEAIAEKLVGQVRATAETALHVMIFSHCPMCMGSEILNAMRDVVLYHEVPVIDSRSICDGHSQNCPLWQPVFVHPTYHAHQVLADVVSFGLRKGLSPECTGEGHYADKILLQTMPSCTKHLSSYSAYAPPDTSRGGVRTSGGWTLREDRPGKPGWIAAQDGANITFDLSFGALPLLIMTYLRSYEGMGDASVGLDGGNRITLQGLWEKNVSETEVFYSQAYWDHDQQGGKYDDNDFGLVGMQARPFTNTTLTVQFLSRGKGTKFKLVEIYTC